MPLTRYTLHLCQACIWPILKAANDQQDRKRPGGDGNTPGEFDDSDGDACDLCGADVDQMALFDDDDPADDAGLPEGD